MTEAEFESYIASVLTEFGESYIDEAIIDTTPHKFSADFEKKMKALIGKSRGNIRIKPKRLITALAAALLAAVIAAASVSAVRESFSKFFMKAFYTHTDVRAADLESGLDDFSVRYELNADMPGFEHEITEGNAYIEHKYYSDGCAIYFWQYLKEYYDIPVNTEGYETESVKLNKREGFYVNMYDQNMQLLTWDHGDYIFSVMATYSGEKAVDRNSFFDIACSVHNSARYEITADISDFELIRYDDDVFGISCTYKNEYCTLYFREHVRDFYDEAVNTEGFVMEKIYINGFEGFYIDMDRMNAQYAAWDNRDYVITLIASCEEGCSMSRERFFEIAESVKKTN